MHIVSTNIDYNYLKMAKNLFTLSKVYPFLNIQVIGHSVLGKKIYVKRKFFTLVVSTQMNGSLVFCL